MGHILALWRHLYLGRRAWRVCTAGASPWSHTSSGILATAGEVGTGG